MTAKIVLFSGMLLVVGIAVFDVFPQFSILLQATSGLTGFVGFAIGE